MKMYVANATRQRHEFFYSIPEVSKRRQITIYPFGQVVLPDDLTKEAIEAIVRDKEPYGFIDVNDASPSRNRGKFAGLCYAIDKAVPAHRIDALWAGNVGILDAQGKALRQSAAIASNQEIARVVAQQAERQDGLRVDVSGVEVSVQQEIESGGPIATQDAISEGFRIQPDPNAANKPKRGRAK